MALSSELIESETPGQEEVETTLVGVINAKWALGLGRRRSIIREKGGVKSGPRVARIAQQVKGLARFTSN